MKIGVAGKLFHWCSFGLWRPEVENKISSPVKVRPKEPDFLFKLSGVKKVFFSGGQEIVALACDRLIIPARKIIGVVGESGSGKSTLLHLLGAVYKPDQGQLHYKTKSGKIERLDSEDFDEDSHRLLRIGWIFQDLNLVSHLKIWENVVLPLFLGGEHWRKHKEKACRFLQYFGIGDKAERRPGELSGGEQQRVAICRALIAEPRVILADEPTGNLDGFNTKVVMEALKELNRKHEVSVIIVTHNLAMAEKYCDQIIICRKDQGNLITCQDEESEEVFQVPTDPCLGSKPAKETGSKPATGTGGFWNENEEK